MYNFEEVKLANLHILYDFRYFRLRRVRKFKIIQKLLHIFTADELIHAINILAVIVGVSQEESADTLADFTTDVLTFRLKDLLAEIVHQIADNEGVLSLFVF